MKLCYATRSRNLRAAASEAYPRIEVDFSLSGREDIHHPKTIPAAWDYLSAEEEILQGPACWMWDFLRRSSQGRTLSNFLRL